MNVRKTSINALLLASFALSVVELLKGTSLPPSGLRRTEEEKIIRYANMGNSMQYYNDFPRLLEQMFTAAGYKVERSSYLRSGANLGSMLEGNLNPLDAWRSKTSTVQELLEEQGPWDFVIINDHSQWPARETSRQETLESVQNYYAPALNQYQPNAVPILIQTQAYRRPNFRGTSDLGDFDQYTTLLTEGYEIYKENFDQWINQESRIAPVGKAYADLHKTKPELWRRLYEFDDFHPAPYGSLLQAIIVFWTITGEAPPAYDSAWWDLFRRAAFWFQLPDAEDAQLIYEAAAKVMTSSA